MDECRYRGYHEGRGPFCTRCGFYMDAPQSYERCHSGGMGTLPPIKKQESGSGIARLCRAILISPFALILAASTGFVLGIVPGLLLGLPGWHLVGAVILSSLWAIGYISQRAKNFGDVNWISFLLAFGGGSGLGTSIWFFGTLTD